MLIGFTLTAPPADEDSGMWFKAPERDDKFSGSEKRLHESPKFEMSSSKQMLLAHRPLKCGVVTLRTPE